MKANQPINFETKLKGMSVLESSTGAKIGNLSDLIIEPVGGKLLGIAVTRPDRQTRSITTEHIRIGADAVMMTNGTPAAPDLSGEFAQGVSAKDILGAKVVSEDGNLIGRIQEIRVRPDTPEIYYRISGSNLQRIFGGGFYISAKLPRAFSPEGKRLIVPADIQERHAKKTLDEFDTGEERKEGDENR